MPARRPATDRKVPVPSGWETFYRVIRTVPRGRVTTYGAIAVLAGRPGAARQVGFALAAVIGPHRKVPWQRVLGARSRGFAVVTIRDPAGGALQRKLLEAEGVRFDPLGRVLLSDYGWQKAMPRTSAPTKSAQQARARTLRVPEPRPRR